jgi:hypothetical protein
MISRIFSYLFRRLPLGVTLLAAAGFLFTTVLPEAAPSPEELPDFDYLPEARRLAEAGDYAGCVQLCDDIISQKFFNAGEAALLRDEAVRKNSSFTHQGGELLKGFLSGDTSSLEAAAGAVVSDLTLYGDLRDLCAQGMNWLTGEETDSFIIALSTVGLATELVDWVDWIPSVLKNFKRAGVLTGRFTKLLTRSALDLCGSRPARRVALAVFSDVGKLLKSVNPHRGKAILRGVDTARELKMLARMAGRSPAKLHLACRSVGAKKLTAALETLPKARALDVAARKGPAGLKALRMLRTPAHAGRLKWAARLGKVFYSQHAAAVARRLIDRAPQIRFWTLLTALVFAVGGAYLVIPPVWKWRRRANARSSAAGSAPTSSETPALPAAADSSAAGRDSPRKAVLPRIRRRCRRRFSAPRS